MGSLERWPFLGFAVALQAAGLEKGGLKPSRFFPTRLLRAFNVVIMTGNIY